MTPLQYTVQTGTQTKSMTDAQLQSGKGFDVTETRTESGHSVHSRVKYDLLGKLAEETKLKRQTVAAVLREVQPAVFGQFKQNPEHFISEVARLINEQKAAVIVERLSYNTVSDRYDSNIFTANQAGQDFSRATKKLKNHIYDYVIADSDVERNFVGELDTSNEVVVYAKLPRGFLIPTPVGDYNPDWAISFKEGAVKHIYFVAETKGSMSTLQLREIESTKIECARKFFSGLNKEIKGQDVRYDVVTDYGKLMEIVGGEV